jgi:hypothetical protein
MQDRSGTPFEVFCQRCRVTHPVGTRRCVHCGGPIGRERAKPRLALPPEAEEVELEDVIQRRSGIFSPVTLLWVVILLGGYLYRSCAGAI